MLPTTDWNYAGGRWHPASTLKYTPGHPLFPKEILLLKDLSAYYIVKDSFPVVTLTESSNALVECGLFPCFPRQQIGTSPPPPFLLTLVSDLGGRSKLCLIMADLSWRRALSKRSDLRAKVAANVTAPGPSPKATVPSAIPDLEDSAV